MQTSTNGIVSDTAVGVAGIVAKAAPIFVLCSPNPTQMHLLQTSAKPQRAS